MTDVEQVFASVAKHIYRKEQFNFTFCFYKILKMKRNDTEFTFKFRLCDVFFFIEISPFHNKIITVILRKRALIFKI